jgi:hypothetical protein
MLEMVIQYLLFWLVFMVVGVILDVTKTFRERCPLTVTANRDNADFIVLLDHEGGKGLARKHNKVAVFKKDGDAIHSGSTRSLGNAVKDACAAIEEPPRIN